LVSVVVQLFQPINVDFLFLGMYDPVMQSARDARQEEKMRRLNTDDNTYEGYRRGSLTGLPVVSGRPVDPAISSPALTPMTETSKAQIECLKALQQGEEPKEAAEPGYYWKHQAYV
jgi:hypothetical protein